MRAAVLLLAIAVAACGNHDKVDEAEPRPPALVAADSTGNIYDISPDTGAATRILQPKDEQGASPGKVSSMEFNGAEGIWWVGTGGQAPCSGCLFELDWKAGELSLLQGEASGPNNDSPGAYPDLCRNPGDSKIYTTEPGADGFVYRLNEKTGVATAFPIEGELGLHGKGCVFVSANRMLVAADVQMTSYNTATAIATPVAFLSYRGAEFDQVSVTVGSMASRTNSPRVFVLVKDGGGTGDSAGNSGTSYLGELNPDTGLVTIIGDTGLGLDGLAFIPGDVYNEIVL